MTRINNRLIQIIYRKQNSMMVSQEESCDIKELVRTLIEFFPTEFDEVCAVESAVEKARTLDKQSSDKLIEELDAARKKEKAQQIEAMYQYQIDMEKARAKTAGQMNHCPDYSGASSMRERVAVTTHLHLYGYK